MRGCPRAAQVKLLDAQSVALERGQVHRIERFGKGRPLACQRFAAPRCPLLPARRAQQDFAEFQPQAAGQFVQRARAPLKPAPPANGQTVLFQVASKKTPSRFRISDCGLFKGGARSAEKNRPWACFRSAFRAPRSCASFNPPYSPASNRMSQKEISRPKSDPSINLIRVPADTI